MIFFTYGRFKGTSRQVYTTMIMIIATVRIQSTLCIEQAQKCDSHSYLVSYKNKIVALVAIYVYIWSEQVVETNSELIIYIALVIDCGIHNYYYYYYA